MCVRVIRSPTMELARCRRRGGVEKQPFGGDDYGGRGRPLGL